MNTSTIAKILTAAGHPGTADHLAADWVRKAYELVDAAGKSFEDVLNPAPAPPPSLVDLYKALERTQTDNDTLHRKVCAVKRERKERDDTIKALRSDARDRDRTITDLEARIAEFEREADRIKQIVRSRVVRALRQEKRTVVVPVLPVVAQAPAPKSSAKTKPPSRPARFRIAFTSISHRELGWSEAKDICFDPRSHVPSVSRVDARANVASILGKRPVFQVPNSYATFYVHGDEADFKKMQAAPPNRIQDVRGGGVTL